MFCKYCGAKIEDNSEYCNYCGGAQHSDSYREAPSFDSGHSYHTLDPYEDEEKTTFDPFETECEPKSNDFDPFSSETLQDTSTYDYTNPFDREIGADLSDINGDQDVIDSYNSGYIVKDGKRITPTHTEIPHTTPPPTSGLGANTTIKHITHNTHDTLTDRERNLAIITLVMAFVCPFVGLFVGKRFFSSIEHIPNPDPYYIRIARLGMKISLIDTVVWMVSMVLVIFIPLLIVFL